MQARSQDRRVRPVAEQAPDPRPRGRGRARGRVAPAAATALLRRHRSRHRRGPARRVDAGAAATPPRRPPKGPPPHQSTSTDANLCLARRRHRRRSTPSSTGTPHRFTDRVAAHRLVEVTRSTGRDVVVVPRRSHPIGAVLPGGRVTIWCRCRRHARFWNPKASADGLGRLAH